MSWIARSFNYRWVSRNLDSILYYFICHTINSLFCFFFFFYFFIFIFIFIFFTFFEKCLYIYIIYEIERVSVSRDEESSPRLVTIDSQLSDLKRQQQELRSKWELERAGVTRLQEIKNQIDSTLTAIAKAEPVADSPADCVDPEIPHDTSVRGTPHTVEPLGLRTQRDDGLRNPLIGRRNYYLIAFREAMAFRRERRRHHREPPCHRLEYLDPRAAAGGKRRDAQMATAKNSRQIGRVGDDLDHIRPCEGFDRRGRRAAGKHQPGGGE